MWRRPWLLFGIGVLLTTVIMATFAASALVRVQRQHQILRDLERLGAGYEYAEQENPWHIPFAWQYPREVTIEVDANACDLHAVLTLANQLVEVCYLKVRNAHVVPGFPIEQIATLTRLRDLSIPGAAITQDDLDRLDSLPELLTLNIFRTPLRYDQVLAWQTARPQVSVGWWPPLTREQQLAVASIKRQGISPHPDDDMLTIEPSCCWHLRLASSPRVWNELSQIGLVRTVILEDMQYVDWDLRQLAKLPGLQVVVLVESSITPAGLAALDGAPELGGVHFRYCDISVADVTQLWQKHPCLEMTYGPRAGPRRDQSDYWLYTQPPQLEPQPLNEFLQSSQLWPPGSSPSPTASPAPSAIP